MMQKSSLPLLVATLALLAGCGPDFNGEAGGEVDQGNFGNATMINTQSMSGEHDYTLALGRRFAAEVPTTINFAFNSAQLSPEAMAILSEQANWIRQFPEVRFRVYGHTDLVGSNAANKALGMRRARAAVNFLVSQGIGSARLEAVVSFGETRPVIATPNPEVRNRRTVTEVIGFVHKGGKPMLLNGKYAAVIMREYIISGERLHPPNARVATEVNSAPN
jgi:peptidoglycan-associated lipoprotein